MGAPRRITGLQRQVYHLYKRSLVMVQSKPLVRFRFLFLPSSPLTLLCRTQETRPAWFAFVAHQFRAPSLGGGIRKKDHAAIEHLIRRGEKMLESYEQTTVKSVGVPQEAWEWPQGWVAKGGKEGREG
jgi:succinate dehydrogenase assembly factor 1